MEKFGFIMLRYVNNSDTNKYWIECYKCIRTFYPENMIVIIDDNSNKDYLTNEELYNTTIIESEFPRRCELLPYYYYLNNNFFDTAVIIHDSVFINKYIDFNVEKYKFIWNFYHNWDCEENEIKMINLYEDEKLLAFYKNKSLWDGCFGGMSIIKHDYLKRVDSKYKLDKLLNVISSRSNRQDFERVIGCLLQKEYNSEPLLGNIHVYLNWDCNNSFDTKEKLKHLPISKIFTGR
jgi:hypothetical protein